MITRIKRDIRQGAANVSDWYLNLLNRLHILPTNAATLLRSISAKQLGGISFTPRPLTADNFTDAELDALHRLALGHGGNYKKTFTYKDYGKLSGRCNISKSDGFESRTLNELMTPLDVLSTTVGSASVDHGNGQPVIRDVYDFDRSKHRYSQLPTGDYISSYLPGKLLSKEDIDNLNDVINIDTSKDSLYRKIRGNAARWAHTEKDPESSRIKVTVPIADIKKRLGNRLGSFDLSKAPSTREIILKGMASGGLTALPVGIAAGTLAGGLRIATSPQKRKKWLKTLILHASAGAGIAGILGAMGGGLTASHINNLFKKKASCIDPKTHKKDKREKLKERLSMAISYGIPAALVLGGGIYAYNKLNNLKTRMTSAYDPSYEYDIKQVAPEDVFDSPDILDSTLDQGWYE